MIPANRQTRVGEIDLGGQLARVEDTAKDYTAGATIGGSVATAIPIPGISTAAGAAIGGWIGGAYGVVDNFGPEVADVLNPPHFTENDYNRMRQACTASGGVPTPGVAPDNYGGCTYGNGDAVSGGDAPFPGTWNHEIRDPAAFERHGGHLSGGGDAAVPMCPGPFGVPIPCSAVPRPATPTQPPQPPPNHIAPMPTVKPKPRVKAMLVKKATILVPHTVINAAHATITAAKLGDAGAAQAIAETIAAARAGDPEANHAAAVLSQAAKLQIRAKYFALYILGRPPGG